MDQSVQSFTKTGAVGELARQWQNPDPWDYRPAELAELQLEALRERFASSRARLRVLDQRARDENVSEIGSLQDAVPLLFSHTTYKSYPPSFLQNGRWDLMTKWLGTLSTHRVDNVDTTGVTSVDEWIVALHRAGHYVITSSGTTGLSSYINRSEADFAQHRLAFEKCISACCGVSPGRTWPYFCAGPENGWNVGGQTHRIFRDTYGKPGDCHAISATGISVADLDRLAMTRKAIVDGTASPEMIANAERESRARMAAVEGDIQIFFDKLFSRRGEPIYLFAGASMLWRIVETGRARGLADGAFHPGSFIFTGGGMKGFHGPADYRTDALRFFGITPDRWVGVYGMTEMSGQFNNCSHGRFHCPPTTIPLILDKAGETLLNPPDGVVEGRGGFFDTTLEGRWGGVISGDRLKVDFSPCGCGRHSPSVVEVARYRDLAEGEEKLTCAGQIDTYVRGVTGGED